MENLKDLRKREDEERRRKLLKGKRTGHILRRCKMISTYKGLASSIAQKGKEGYQTIQTYFGEKEKEAGLKEWFTWSANYAYWTASGCLVFVEGVTELSGVP